MTPKVKAAYLVVKYMSKVVSKSVAKECALVAVDEITANIEPSVSMDVIEARIKYWQEVKQEIETI
jgi:hypothetical protein